MIRYVRMADPELLPPGRHASLDRLSERCEALPAFEATWPADYVLPSAWDGSARESSSAGERIPRAPAARYRA